VSSRTREFEPEHQFVARGGISPELLRIHSPHRAPALAAESASLSPGTSSGSRMDASVPRQFGELFFENATPGAIYARGLLTVLVILLLVFGLHQAWRMKQAFRILDENTKDHQARDRAAAHDAISLIRGPRV
jgi:hypothetical protein